MATEPLNYVDYELDDLILQLQNRLALRDSWKDTYKSGTGQTLIELFSGIGNLVLYYIERRAQELYIATAQNKSSVVNLVRLLNYVPKRNVSAVGTLKFTISAASTKLIYIPKYTECQTSGSVKYLVSEDVVLMPGQLYVEANGIQGEKVVTSSTSTGSTSQTYKINDTQVENTNISVDVGGVEWTKVDSFIDSTVSSTDYVIRPELDDTITIVFGDNVHGMAPSIGSTITITYIKSLGLAGCVYELGRITTLNSTIYDSDSAIVSNVTVSNTSTFLGGDDAEDIEEIRSEAPQVFSTGDRAVTREDHKTILRNYSGVADANAWGENEETSPDYNMYNQVKLVVILEDWELPDTAFETTLSDYLYTKALQTVRYSFVDPDILNVIPTMTIKCNRGSNLSYIQSLIDAALADEFTLGTTTTLGESKRLSDVVSIVEDVSGVSYSYITLKILDTLTDSGVSINNWTQTLTALPLLPGGIGVYINDVLIGSDDGSNSFITSSSSYTLGGTVDYTTGEVALDISPSPLTTDVVTVRYQQDEDGDVVTTQNQICKLYDTVYTSIAYVS